MQARRRRRDRAGLAREDGLVVEAVLRVGEAVGAVDVRRQGSGAERREIVEERERLLPCFVEPQGVEAAFGAHGAGVLRR